MIEGICSFLACCQSRHTEKDAVQNELQANSNSSDSISLLHSKCKLVVSTLPYIQCLIIIMHCKIPIDMCIS